jgi:hypothetical protein
MPAQRKGRVIEPEARDPFTEAHDCFWVVVAPRPSRDNAWARPIPWVPARLLGHNRLEAA